jgi:D-alanyl-D-alanine carboxypeptidase (penicillin-binding protein 5/6)
MVNRRIILLILVAALIVLPGLGFWQQVSAEGKGKAITTGLMTTAESAVLMDANGTVLYEKNSHKPLPPASVTKSMTLLLAVEAVEQGKLQLTDEVYTSENAWKQGGSQIWLEQGEKMSVHDLLVSIAVVSANDAAVAMMEHIYGSEQAAVDAMNKRSEELGLTDTHFSNVNGLPIANHHMSAYDTALIVKEAVKHPLYLELCSIKEYWLRNGKNWLVNTNKLLWWYNGADGLKTGWTEQAKYCFAGTAKRDGLRLIAVVFGAPEPRAHLRESMKLFDYGFANYSALSVVEQGAVIERMKVTKGEEQDVQLVAAGNLSLLLSKGQSNSVQKKVVAEPSSVAPIQQGQKYGELVVLRDGKEIDKVDLVAEKSIARAGFIRIFQEMVADFFALSH